MTAIRAMFDGKAFVPQQPVSLPDRFEVLVLADHVDAAAQAALDAAVREYYQSADDVEDVDWARVTARDSHLDSNEARSQGRFRPL